MVCGIAGDADAGGVCDPDGGKPVSEPSERAAADWGGCCLGCRRGAAVHAPGRRTWVYPITVVVAGCDCAACPDIPDFSARGQDLVLSAACVALTGRTGRPRWWGGLSALRTRFRGIVPAGRLDRDRYAVKVQNLS